MIIYKNTLIAALSLLGISSSSLLAQEEILRALETKAKTPTPVDPAEIKAKKKEMSYGLGFQNGEQFASFGFIADDLDRDAYIKGLIEALMKKDFANDPIAYDKAMKLFDRMIAQRERELAAANKKAQKEYLEKNGDRKEVITTKSGLQYEIITKGTGKKYTAPKNSHHKADQATDFHLKCKGTLLDGSVFMETPKDKTIPYKLNVIPGLAEALKMMPVGSKWKLYIPAKLAFGEMRQGPKISPASMLTYELELTDIKVKAMPKTPQFPSLPNNPKLPLIPR